VIAPDASGRALYDETVDDYKRYLNPPLARVMKLSGAPVEVHASGSVVTTHDGERYLDFAGGYGVFTLGHAHPRVTAAVREQLDAMAMSTRTMFNPLMGRLARRLAEITPGDLQISFFSNSGTEAVEAALKLARAATGCTRIVATENAYHGKTFGALSVSGREAFRASFAPLVPDVVHVPFGDLEALAAALPNAAAFIVEPVQAEGGVVLPPAGYLAAARALCAERGVVFVADEVQTGLGRCGTLFACDAEGVVPDVLVLAKGLSGGIVPIGATVATAEVWNAAYGRAPLLHTSTFGGNELACAAALAALDVLVEDGLVERSRVAGERLLRGAQAVAARYPDVVAVVRGRGLLVGIELRVEGYGGAVVAELLKRRVTAAWTLNMQRVIRLEPPFVVTDAEIAAALLALDGALAATFASLGRL
jgi:putrescine aminotransferase